MARILVSDLSLDAIASSGQVFTWVPAEGGSWLVSSGTHRCRARQEGDVLELAGTDGSEPTEDELGHWLHYLALDMDYGRVLSGLELPEGALEANRGLRVLAQDWWDAAVSFVISQNSNIARIQRTVLSLMEAGGGCVPRPGELGRLLGDEGFADSLRLGYRRPYLVALDERARSWRPRRLDDATVSLEESMAELEGLPGIGPKVASCICLFGLGYLEAVPKDTWIRRAEASLHISWDPVYGGIQQQYVFAWSRERGRAG